MASQLGAARLLFAMGEDGALPRRFFGTLNPVRRIPQNNVLLIGGIVLIGALAMSYQLGTELLNYGALLAFMGVNVASAVLAWRTKDANPWVPMLLSGSGFVVCFFPMAEPWPDRAHSGDRMGSTRHRSCGCFAEI